ERYVTEELDFLREGRNAEMIAAVFAGRSDVVVPKIVWEHSSRKVLVMEYLDGIKVTDLERLRSSGVEPERVAEQRIRTCCDQIPLQGLFHADPHPGNIFVQPPVNGSGPARLALLDFGLVKTLPNEFRHGLAEVLLAMLRGRPADVLMNLGRIGF